MQQSLSSAQKHRCASLELTAILIHLAGSRALYFILLYLTNQPFNALEFVLFASEIRYVDVTRGHSGPFKVSPSVSVMAIDRLYSGKKASAFYMQ